MTHYLPEWWIIASVAAAGFQTLRFMLQKVLAVATLTATGTTFARFLYSAPVIAAGLFLYLKAGAAGIPSLGQAFWIYAPIGGAAQVTATVCTVALLKMRNFAVGVTLIKTEVILSAIFGFLLLGDSLTPVSLIAILSGVAGVMLLSSTPDVRTLRLRDMWNRSTFLGLAGGALFGVSAVCYRGASLQVISEDAVLRALITLSFVTALQMVGMAVWLFLRDSGQISAVWRARRRAVWIGLLSMAGSFCWFFAFTLQNAAYVKAIGQIELVFGLLASVVFFSEKVSFREYLGIAVLCASILMLILISS